MSEQFVGILLDIGYILIGLAAVGSVVFPLVQIVGDTKKLLRMLVSLGVLGVIFLVCFVIADGTVTPEYIELGINESTSRIVGALLNMVFALLGLSVLAILYSEVSKSIK